MEETIDEDYKKILKTILITALIPVCMIIFLLGLILPIKNKTIKYSINIK
ncbi:hypothetical protein [uncultured Fusobacterium sp.]|nr:hypothetical protein [uncultured Fusobacterium sp.]